MLRLRISYASHPIGFIHISFGIMEGLGCCFLAVAKLNKGVDVFQSLPSLISLPPIYLIPLLRVHHN